MKNTRIIALFLMAIISTASPTLYQQGIQPRVEGAACSISILNVELDEELTEEHIVVFTAYLAIENTADVEVVLSRLTLDVYHHSKSIGRYRMIGTMNTTDEFKIPASSKIYTRRTPQGLQTLNPLSKSQLVTAKIALIEDEPKGSATSEAIGELIQKGFISIMLKGKAQVGPFEFDYQKHETLQVNFWDPNFVILDVFNYYQSPRPKDFPTYIANTSSPEYNTDYACVVVRALMHNPSGIPMTLQNYTFDLYTQEGESVGAGKVATGISIDELAYNAHDPDYLDSGARRRLVDTYLGGNTSIVLHKNPKIWTDVLFMFNFTDPAFWDAPGNQLALTRPRMQWFMTRLFNDGVIDNIYLKGECAVILGWIESGTTGKYRGIRVEIGDLLETTDSPPFIIPNVKFHQHGYDEYERGTQGKPMKDYLSIGNINVTKLEINQTADSVKIDLNASLEFGNPYRLGFNITNLVTDYYRTNLDGIKNESDTVELANGVIAPDLSLFINRTRAINSSAGVGDPDFLNFTIGTIQVPHTVQLEYTSDEIISSGIGKLFADLGINPLTLNISNPFWLMGPESAGKMENADPTKVMEYLIKNGIDPLMLLKDVNTTVIRNFGDYAWYPLECSHFGTDFGNTGQKFTPNKDMYTTGVLTSINGISFRAPVQITTNWGQYALGITEPNQYDVVRHKQHDGGVWTWEPTVYGGSGADPENGDLNGIIMQNLPDTISGLSLPASWYPKNLVTWRIYTDDAESYWGFNYDTTYGKRGWYLTRGPVSKALMLKQNFTIDLTRISSIEDIDSSWMSMSYQFPAGTIVDRSSDVRLGIGYWNTTENEYIYEAYTDEALNNDGIPINASYLLTTGTNSLFEGPRYGYCAINPNYAYSNSRDWHVFRVNVTRYIKEAYQRYLDTGDENNLRLEISAFVSGGNAMTVNIDDITLQINHVQRISGQFRFSDLIQYLERNGGKQKGNIFNFLDSLEFNATNLVAFAESTLGLNPSGMLTDANLTNYLAATDFSFNNMMDVLNDISKARATNSPGGFNFLDVLNRTRFNSTFGDSETEVINQVSTPYGPRTLIAEDGEWVVEDPYRLSKALIDALKEKMFYYENGSRIEINPNYPQQGKELWMMFENLGITLPWLVTYLIISGWSKDDVFDAFEAVGFLSQTKRSTPELGSFGVMKMDTKIYARANAILMSRVFHNEVHTLWQVLGKAISNPIANLFHYLGARNPTSAQYLAGLEGYRGTLPNNVVQLTQPLIHYKGTIEPQYYTTNKYESRNPGFFGVDMFLDLEPHNYELIYWLYGLPGSSIVPRNYDLSNPFASVTSDPGLNALGVQELAKFLRTVYYCQEHVFLKNPGNPIALFQFLDDYAFNESTYIDPITKTQQKFDYTSYTLMNKYNVLASDFFELAMGWDRVTGQFDPNGNGKADDWIPPYNDTLTWGNAYNWYNTGIKPTTGGWGRNFVDNRIFWNNASDPRNGKVIWSDSRQFVDLNQFNFGETLDFQDGAPPLINLFDFLLWCSKSLGYPSSEDIFKWIQGDMPASKYLIQHPDNPDVLLTGNENPKEIYNCGLGLNKLWNVLAKGSFNITGFVNTLENTRKTNVWGLFQEMNNYCGDSSQSPSPWGFIDYLMTPNYAFAGDGTSRIWMYHDGVGAKSGNVQQDTINSRDAFWLLFNGSWWDQISGGDAGYWDQYETNPLDTLPGLIFLRLRQMELEQINDGKTGKDVTFNTFQLLYNLGVKPDEWLKLIEQQGILPFEVIGVFDSLNYTKLFTESRDLNKKTRIKINGTFGFEIADFKLSDYGFFIDNQIAYEIGPDDYYANNQLRYFWEIQEYSISSGTLVFVY